MTCFGKAESMTIESLKPRIAAPPLPRGPSVFSDRNVWNSCLLFARANGFSLQLIGDPDKHGGISRCRWRATNEDRSELAAETPSSSLA